MSNINRRLLYSISKSLESARFVASLRITTSNGESQTVIQTYDEISDEGKQVVMLLRSSQKLNKNYTRRGTSSGVRLASQTSSATCTYLGSSHLRCKNDYAAQHCGTVPPRQLTNQATCPVLRAKTKRHQHYHKRKSHNVACGFGSEI